LAAFKSSRFATVEDAEDDEAPIGEPVLEYVGRVQNLQHELAVFPALGERSAKARKLGQHIGPRDDFLRHDAGEFGVMLLQEGSKSLEVIEGVLRPLDY
jgi:hypothetical protein